MHASAQARGTVASSVANEAKRPGGAHKSMIMAGDGNSAPKPKTAPYSAATLPPLLSRQQVSAPSNRPGLIGSLQTPLAADDLSITKSLQPKEAASMAMPPVLSNKQSSTTQKLTEQPPMPVFEGEGYVEVGLLQCVS